MKANVRTDLGDRIMKVNHAGEFGAICIYTGQIFMAKFTAPKMVEELREFRMHERKHRGIFGDELMARSRPKCRSYWLCGTGGLVLGLFTGLLGTNAIAATTVAVESVVLRHLEHQLSQLEGKDPDAVRAISRIIEDERDHHDQSLSHLNLRTLWSKVLTPIVSASTETVIWLGMRL